MVELPDVFMEWGFPTANTTVAEEATYAIEYFETKYEQKVKAIACHTDTYNKLHAALETMGILVFIDTSIFASNILHVYGETDALHKEKELL